VASSRRDIPLMQILCSNDDGILAPGLGCLIKAAEPLGEITVVAPDREQSATSHSLTLHHPVRPVKVGERRYQVDGTPTDCVMLGVEVLMPTRPDFVLSGINHGQNMGEDVLYSGTVAAAMEGLVLGIPSIAVSFAGRGLRSDPDRLGRLVDPLTKLLRHIMALQPFPRDTLFNVNFPPVDEVQGVRLTRLGRRVFSNSIQPMKDPWGRQIYWIGAGSMSWSGGEDSDYHAVANGYISVTPLHLDLTNRSILESSAEWWSTP
jgi:5'-nucleotidase